MDYDYFFKCTVRSITCAQNNACEVAVRPFAEYSVKSGDKVYVAFMPKPDSENGLLLKYDNHITIENVKNPLCLLKCSNNCTVYVKKIKGKGDLNLGGLSFRVTKISIEI